MNYAEQTEQHSACAGPGHVLPSILIVYGQHARLDNIDEKTGTHSTEKQSWEWGVFLMGVCLGFFINGFAPPRGYPFAD